MSLFHSRPVPVQHVYYKPSAVDRLKAMLSPNRHQRTHPRATTTTPRRIGRKKAVTRQPVRKTGLFHRNPRRTVVAAQRKPGFLGSLRPRHSRATRIAPESRGHRGRHSRPKHDKHHHGHKGSILATVIALFALKKKHDHDKKHHHRRRHHF